MAASIETTYVRDTCIGSTCTVGTWIGYTSIGGTYTKSICTRSAFIGGVESRTLARFRVTLVDPGINNCYL